MIRLVSSRYLRSLAQEARAARERAREVRGEADAAYAAHLVRERALATAVAAAEEELAAVRREALAREEASLEPVALLSRYGVPHSVHADNAAARGFASRHGAHPDGWVPRGEQSVETSAWQITVFNHDADSNAFISSIAPPLPGEEDAR